MKVLTCADVLDSLEAYCDRELPVGDHIAVEHHLSWCRECGEEHARLRAIGEALRAAAAARPPVPVDAAAFAGTVVSRLEAERAVSWPSRVSQLFEDMHLVWAGLSATAATATCAALLFAIWFLAPPERADSLAGILSALAAPGSDRNPVAIDHLVSLPRGIDSADAVPAALASTTEEDLVLALAAVVTREGRVTNPELLLTNGEDREVALRLMNAVREARFHPASRRGSPVAVNLVWLLTHTTVRGKTHS